ncbi:MAG: hypothetical protein RSG57_05390 [Christensenellaceae bacterium]
MIGNIFWGGKRYVPCHFPVCVHSSVPQTADAGIYHPHKQKLLCTQHTQITTF